MKTRKKQKLSKHVKGQSSRGVAASAPASVPNEEVAPPASEVIGSFPQDEPNPEVDQDPVPRAPISTHLITSRKQEKPNDSIAVLARRVPQSVPSDASMYCKVQLFGQAKPIGFVILPSVLRCTFSDARKQIMDDLVPEYLPAEKVWRFYIPCMESTLSKKQEVKLGRIIDNFGLLGAEDEWAGNFGSPVTLVLKEIE